MVDKTPVRVVFDSSNVATGLGEFQTGETVPVANGGTGLSSLGASLTTLRVNEAGDALEFAAAGGDLDIRGDDSTSMVIALATQSHWMTAYLLTQLHPTIQLLCKSTMV